MSASHRFGPNSGYIEELYKLYQIDPSLVGSDWQIFFQNFEVAETPQQTITPQIKINGNGAALPEPEVQPQVAPQQPQAGYTTLSESDVTFAGLQERVYRMVSAYRGRGHFQADINPLSQGIFELPEVQDLKIDFYNYSAEELQQTVTCAGFQGQERMNLQQLIDSLQQVYCGSLGFEFTHLVSQEERAWIQSKIETRFQEDLQLTYEQKLRRLKKILEAELFESELHRTYIGHKRFSLQGGETLVPMLASVISESSELGVEEAYIGMSHRGRLNVLVNVLGKPLENVFSEFEDQNIFTVLGSGDVKYHMGYERLYQVENGKTVKLTLAPNPSHLEFVDPVVEGMARARQDTFYGRERSKVLPILIHGDAAFIGQGIVPETVNLARVNGYRTGGTIHIIVNNQIGFTTNPDESRSTVYCTDMAKAAQAPVIHVNCEDVESACWAMKLATEFRERYGRDVIVDLYCYRKYGHNEGDDPSFTQPITYSEIKKKSLISQIYKEQLISEQHPAEADAKAFTEEFKARFQSARKASSEDTPVGEACDTHGRIRERFPDTGIPLEELKQIAGTLLDYPESFNVHPKLHKILEKRVATLEDGHGIDWGFAEGLAFGSMVSRGTKVRLSGQDCGRGTFSQRHLLLSDYQGGEPYIPFNRLCPTQDICFEVYNSPLSEAAVLGFEFGYSSIAENALVLWEGQFGDFANGAQVVIDQFIAASEQKWGQLSGVVMLLPHGYEGQGPEHSSARLERYLQLCADGNMVVCYPSNAAQYFHLLRRQGLSKLRRPVIVMTPKSLLRDQRAACGVEELVHGTFNDILISGASPERARGVLLCSGKVYYDLVQGLQQHDTSEVCVVRLEQLYPFPEADLLPIAQHISQGAPVVWAQEEPRNMGAWTFVEPELRRIFDREIHYAGRVRSASTATGSHKRHVFEQAELVEQAISLLGVVS